MERAFIVSKDVGYGKALQRYCNIGKDRYDKVIDFLRVHSIQATGFHLGGDGVCNCSFSNYNKDNIQLAIVPTKEDEHLLGGILLSKVHNEGLRYLRRNSKLMREFQQYCVDEEIIINHHKPDLWDYFKSFSFERYSSQRFGLNDVFYLKVDCDSLTEDDTPEGMTAIKLSEYYTKLEEFQANEEL